MKREHINLVAVVLVVGVVSRDITRERDRESQRKEENQSEREREREKEEDERERLKREHIYLVAAVLVVAVVPAATSSLYQRLFAGLKTRQWTFGLWQTVREAAKKYFLEPLGEHFGGKLPHLPAHSLQFLSI